MAQHHLSALAHVAQEDLARSRAQLASAPEESYGWYGNWMKGTAHG
jgi:hypothetical protein